MPIEIVTGMAPPLLDGERLGGDAPAQPLRHHGGHRHVGLRHDDDELFAAVPAREIDAADRSFDAQREIAQHVVAGIVAVGVVDRLEIIDVDHQRRQRLAARGGLLDQRAEMTFHERRLNRPVSASVIAISIDICTLSRSRSV